jgi:hypothetical protein
MRMDDFIVLRIHASFILDEYQSKLIKAKLNGTKKDYAYNLGAYYQTLNALHLLGIVPSGEFERHRYDTYKLLSKTKRKGTP